MAAMSTIRTVGPLCIEHAFTFRADAGLLVAMPQMEPDTEHSDDKNGPEQGVWIEPPEIRIGAATAPDRPVIVIPDHQRDRNHQN